MTRDVVVGAAWRREELLFRLRQSLAEPRLLDVERFEHGGATWWRLTVACGCDQMCYPSWHEPAVRMVPNSDFRKPRRLSRRVGRWVSDAEARQLVRALYEYVEAKEQ